jgi:hypothetical protein
MTKYPAFFGIVALVLMLILPATAGEQPTTATPAKAQGVETMRSMFASPRGRGHPVIIKPRKQPQL